MNRRPLFRFQLYVTEDAQNSLQAVANLSALCRKYLPGRHKITVVDVLKEPQRALADSIFMTPTLVKLSPMPTKRIIGTLSNTPTLLENLGLEARAQDA